MHQGRLRQGRVVGLAAVILAGLVAQIALAGGSDEGPRATASAVTTAKFKKLKRQVAELRRQVETLARQPGPQGPKGEPGPIGPQGPSGVISSASLLGGPGIPNPDGTLRFLALPVVVTVPPGAKVLVSSHRAFGTSGAAAGALNLFMCTRIAGSLAPDPYGNGIIGMQLPANSKVTMGFSRILENLTPAVYEVGLCGTGGANWNNNDWGSTTALVLE